MIAKKLSSKERETIAKILEERNARAICPMCKNDKMIIADGYFVNSLSVDGKNLNLGGKAIPSIPTICSNCGHISLHALGVLGLLPIDKEDSKNKS